MGLSQHVANGPVESPPAHVIASIYGTGASLYRTSFMPRSAADTEYSANAMPRALNYLAAIHGPAPDRHGPLMQLMMESNLTMNASRSPSFLRILEMGVKRLAVGVGVMSMTVGGAWAQGPAPARKFVQLTFSVSPVLQQFIAMNPASMAISKADAQIYLIHADDLVQVDRDEVKRSLGARKIILVDAGDSAQSKQAAGDFIHELTHVRTNGSALIFQSDSSSYGIMPFKTAEAGDMLALALRMQ